MQRIVRRGATLVPILVAFLVMFGHLHGANAQEGSGQTITGHKLIAGEGTMPMVEFTTSQSIPRNFWAYIPQDVLNGQVPIASIYWHGDDESGYLDRNRAHLETQARRIETDVDPIVVYRPHSVSAEDGWRSYEEMHLHFALLRYIQENWGVEKFNLYGFSSGGTIAIAVATEMPHLAATVGMASPVLDVRALRDYHNRQFRWLQMNQYSPIDHLEENKGTLRQIPILIVHDPRDQRIGKSSVKSYVKLARKRGLKIRYVEVRLNDHPYHHSHRRLGRHLRKAKGFDFRPQR